MMRAPWSTLGLAIDIAYHAHISQFDKAGGWYTGHLVKGNSPDGAWYALHARALEVAEVNL